MIRYWEKIENILSHVKFAIIIILVFAIYLIVGTFVESYHGTAYANVLIYKSLPFLFTQVLMFLSIFYATLKRLPIKKRLRGFYLLHLGLILLFAGSFLTYKVGIDGQMILTPNDANSKIELPEEYIHVTKQSLLDKDDTATYSLELPKNSSTTNLNQILENFHFTQYLPFSDQEIHWSKNEQNKTLTPNVQYYLENDFTSQDIFLSLNENTLDFQSSTQLGPLSVHLLPTNIKECLFDSAYLFWNQKEKKCYTLEKMHPNWKALENTTQSKRPFIILQSVNDHDNPIIYTFFPDTSPYTYDKDLQVVQNSEWRIFNKKIFEEQRHVLIFENTISYYNNHDAKWEVYALQPGDKQDLPWMNFTLKLIKYSNVESLEKRPFFTKPIQENGKIIRGEQKAVFFTFNGEEYWISSQRPMNLTWSGVKWTIQLVKRSVALPFKINLNNFVLKTNPGENSPASYESYVSLFTSKGSTDHKIYMNHPLKYNGLTFYQSSYFPLNEENTQYGSILSVNWDPARGLKYFGAFLLVFGTMLHFYLKRESKNAS